MQSTNGNRLAELMAEHGVERHEIVAICERDSSTVGRWISGAVPIPDDAKRALSTRFSCTVEYLLGWDRSDSATQVGAG